MLRLKTKKKQIGVSNEFSSLGALHLELERMSLTVQSLSTTTKFVEQTSAQVMKWQSETIYQHSSPRNGILMVGSLMVTDSCDRSVLEAVCKYLSIISTV